MKKYLLLLSFVLSNMHGFSQFIFQKTYGSSSLEVGSCAEKTSDGGYIITGYGYTNVPGTFYDVYLIKTDFNGDTLWTKTFGGGGFDLGHSVIQATDGGYVVCGQTRNISLGNDEVYLIKTNSVGDTLWTKTFGRITNDCGNSIKQTSDGGYIIAGSTYQDGALWKTDSMGNLNWNKFFSDPINDVQLTADGSFILTGSESGSGDAFLIKMDLNGNEIWSKDYWGVGNAYGYSAKQTFENGYIMTGSVNGDVLLVKTDTIGSIEWSKSYGDINADGGLEVEQTTDSGYIITGYKAENTTAAYSDAYLIKTDQYGDVIWAKTYGTTGSDEARSVMQTSDGGYAIAGSSVVLGLGLTDIYLLKLDSLGNSGCLQQDHIPFVTTGVVAANNGGSNGNSLTYTVTSSPTVVGSGTQTTTLCTTVGFNHRSSERNNFDLSPNPAGNKITLLFSNEILSDVSIRIFNLLGREVFKQTIFIQKQFTVPLNTLPNGAYILEVYYEGKKEYAKFVKG